MNHSLVGKQMKRWEMNERVRRRFEEDELEVELQPAVITLSRARGSGGTSIAKTVAKRLDFKVFDREIINRIAELTGDQPEQIDYHEEAKYGVLGDMLLHLLEGRRHTAAGYFRALVETLVQIGRQGEVVIIGRGSNFVLPDAYNVRVVAPEKLRIARLSELHEVSKSEAGKNIKESDKRRRRFINSHFDNEWNDPLGYDITINTANHSIEHAAGLIIKGFTDRRQCLQEACETIHGDSSSGRQS